MNGPINPNATRYVNARAALQRQLEDMLDAVARGGNVPTAAELEPTITEYKAARVGFRGAGRVA